MKEADTMQETLSKPARRRHDPQLKLQVVAACRQPGASVASIAMVHGLNSNMVHRWLREQPAAAGAAVPALVTVPEKPASFTAVPFSGAGLNHEIRLELRRGNATMMVSWPVSAADACSKLLAQWLR